MKPFRFYKNIRKPSHTICTHCFVFFVDDGKDEKTYILRDMQTDFEGADYDSYIKDKIGEIKDKYKANVNIEGSRLGLWEYQRLLELGVSKL